MLCANRSQFDLCFTKDNSIIRPSNLDHWQRKHFRRAVEEKSDLYEKLVNDMAAAVRLESERAQRFVSWLVSESQCSFLLRGIIIPPTEVPVRAKRILDQTMEGSHGKVKVRETLNLFFNLPREELTLGKYGPLILGHVDNIRECLDMTSAESWDKTGPTTAMNPIQAFIAALSSSTSKPDVDVDQSKQLRAAINKDLYTLLRWLIAFGQPGMGIMQTMAILGKEVSMARFDSGIRELQEREKQEADDAK